MTWTAGRGKGSKALADSSSRRITTLTQREATMDFPPTNRTRLHVNGEIEIEGADEPTPVPLPEETDTVTLSGRVTQARTGTALRGLRVLALADADPEHATPLGSSTSNADGRFRIQFDDRPEVRERLLALRNLPGSRLTLRVETGEGHGLFTSRPIALDR